ncbi:DUF3093 domain-containing protein [Galactobacter caseinivorans]|nr:DUF3093 domain-containing protein [Galactobacter caseinivorans]
MSTPSASTPTSYTEKLRAPWWLWLVVAGISIAIGLALSPTNPVLCGILIAVAFIIAVVLLTVSAPTIAVNEQTLSVGRASIERQFLGEVTGHRGESARYERGRGLHGLAFMCFRGWVDPVVKVIITDPRDETPYWLFSTRRPEELIAALGGHMVHSDPDNAGVITEASEPSSLERERLQRIEDAKREETGPQA